MTDDQRRPDRLEVHGPRPLQRVAQRAASSSTSTRCRSMHTVVGRNAAELDAFAARWGWQATTTDWRAAITAAEIGLVDIATPNDVHAEQSIAALEAGKHVACEKPLAGTLADAEAMAAAAAGAGGNDVRLVQLPPRAGRRARPPARRRSGALGRIYHVRACYLQSWGGPEHPAAVALPGRRRRLRRARRPQRPHHRHGALHHRRGDRHGRGRDRAHVHHRTRDHRWRLRRRDRRRRSGDEPTPRRRAPSTMRCCSSPASAAAGWPRSRPRGSPPATTTRTAFEIHGERGALRFDFERMNELELLRRHRRRAAAGLDDDRRHPRRRRHPYAAAWWPDSHGLGYEHGFVNQAADILAVDRRRPARRAAARLRRRPRDPAGPRTPPSSRPASDTARRPRRHDRHRLIRNRHHLQPNLIGDPAMTDQPRSNR